MKNYLAVIIFLVLTFLLSVFLVGRKEQKGTSSILPKKGEKMIIRNPAVSGQFYPEGKNELKEMIEGFLDKVDIKRKEGQLSVLIVPHAGYIYSGQTAAYGIKNLDKNIKNVILLGASHQAWFNGVAIDDSDYWQTPLGKVKVNKDLGKRLITEGIEFNRRPHLYEHSLEVELPFLQKVCGDCAIIPLLIGQTDDKTLENLAEKIINNFDNKTVLIISSDLSHYPDIETARIVDTRTIEAIKTAEVEKFTEALKKLSNEYPLVDTFACGHEAIKVGMMVAKKLGILKTEVFHQTNSGEVVGDSSRVVGYVAMGFYTKIKEQEEELDKNSQKELLKFSRKVLESYIKEGKIPDDQTKNQNLLKKRGAFVTLTKYGQLRGCIGDFSASKSLWETVKEMTIAAAVNDPRFMPVQKNELSDIEIEISVLSPRKKVSSYKEIIMGKHGVYLERDGRGGTFLPQVAEDFNYDRDAFLAALCSHKAGLPPDCYKDKKTNLYIYTAQVFSEKELEK